MSEAIYIESNDELIRMELDAFSKEDDFQNLLERFPDLLAGDQISPGSPRRWLLIKREAGVPCTEGGSDRWSLDHLFIDQDAIPTLVEVKRKSDTRLRREVVGQMMDYAANAIAYWPGETLKDLFYQTVEADHTENRHPDEKLATFLEANSEGLNEVDEFWQTANENLKSGNVRLIFVADRIPSELQRIVEFMNERMSPTEVLALEVRRYSGGEFSTHIPRLLGQTSAAQFAKKNGIPPKSAPRSRWNEDKFFEHISEKLGPNQVSNIRKILDFCKQNGFDQIDWGTGSTYGSFNPKFKEISKRGPITVWSNGQLDIKLAWLNDTEIACTFRDRLIQRIQEEQIPVDCSANDYIKVQMDDWANWIDQFMELIRSTAEDVLALNSGENPQ